MAAKCRRTGIGRMKRHVSLSYSVYFAFLILLSGWTFQKKEGPGNPQLLHYGQLQNLSAGTVLQNNDTLIVGKTEKVLLSEGDSKTWVGSNAVLKISHIDSEEKAKLLLESGKIRVKIQPEEAKKWKFETRSTVSGVRGTEFFISSTDSSENICVLEGLVESTVNNIADLKVQVPAGKGVVINQGEIPILMDNSEFLVQQWISETSLDDEEPSNYIPERYSRKTKIYPIKNHMDFRLSADVLYCDWFNSDFNKDTKDKNRNCLRAHIYPRLTWSDYYVFILAPRLSTVQTNQSQFLDTTPSQVGVEKSGAYLSEVFTGVKTNTFSVYLGLQKVSLADGYLLNDQSYSNEPLSHLSLKISDDRTAIPFDFYYTKGQQTSQTADGKFPFDLTALQLHFLTHSSNLYFMQAKGEIKKGSVSDLNLNHVGLFSKNRNKNFEYQTSLILQKGDYSLATKNLELNETLVDLKIAYYLSPRVRTSLRSFDISPKFTSLVSNQYALGFLPTLNVLNNINQLRFAADFRVNETTAFGYEWIRSHEKDSNGLKHWTVSSQNDQLIGEEHDFIYSNNFSELANYQVIGFIFQPDRMTLNKDVATGLQVRASISF